MLVINETYVNETRGWRLGESGYYSPFTDDLGELYRCMQKEHGRCISKVYMDVPDGTACPVGWVFEKRRKFADSDDTYLQHVLVHYKDVDEKS